MIGLVLLSLVIACSIGWIAMNKWMESFADHTAIRYKFTGILAFDLR
jgi:hypothetical protein